MTGQTMQAGQTPITNHPQNSPFYLLISCK
jgi:hypothetical protein